MRLSTELASLTTKPLKSQAERRTSWSKTAIAGGGDVVEVHVGAHEGGDAGVARGFEGREIDVPHQLFGDVGGVVVAAAVGGAVSGEVFGGGEDVVGATPLAALEAEDLRASDGRAEIGVFAGAFDHAAPAGVAGDVDHWTESPSDADGAGFFGGDGLGLLDHCGIPRGSGADRRWEDCAIAVDDVEAEEDRDMEAGFFDRDVLEAVDFFGIGNPEHRAGAALFDDLLDGLAVGIAGELGDSESRGAGRVARFFRRGSFA